MENDKPDYITPYQKQKNDCVKRLFDLDGILYNETSELAEIKRYEFIQTFISNIEVQSAVTKFFLEIKRQCNIALYSTEQETPKAMAIDDNSETTSNVKLLTLNCPKTMDDDLVKQPDLSKPFDNSESQTLQSQQSQASVPITTETQPMPQQQLKPGEIPATAPAPKQAPVSELSKTSFSMSANGRANEAYRGKISGANKSGKNILIKQVDIPADLGLSFDAGTCEVFGTPTQAGDFDLRVHFQFETPSPANPTPVGVCTLIVNPDPKTLWKNLDSDRSDKYWKEDTDTIFVPGSDGLAMIVASKRGRSHAHNGTFRDDDFKVDHDVLTGWRIMTVADGAGSAKKSRRGSQIATRVANESIFKALKGDRGQKLQDTLVAFNSDPSKIQRPVLEELYYLFGNAAREAVHAINTEATTEGVPFKEFSTTLIITVHKRFDFGHFIGAYWVGDGGAGIFLKGQELNVLGKADSGEFAGQTRFLDTAMVDPTEIMNRIRFKVVKDFTAVLAMTDGITDPKFETDANIENIQMWDSLWAELEPTTLASKPKEALLDWLDFWSAGNHDDRTIGILCPIKHEISDQQGAN